MEEEKASGHEITRLEFLGPCFDANTQRLTCIYSRNHGEYFTQGYADAFSDPPYLLESTWEETNTLFLALNSYLFDNFQHEHEIYAWSTDWSNYFDAGKEWWGAFLWTFYNKAKGFIVAVGASTTD